MQYNICELKYRNNKNTIKMIYLTLKIKRSKRFMKLKFTQLYIN